MPASDYNNVSQPSNVAGATPSAGAPGATTLIAYPLVAVLGGDHTGQAASLALEATDSNGAVLGLGLSAWTEEISGSGLADTGTYQAMGQFDPAWAYPIVVNVTIAGVAKVIAKLVVRASDLATLTANGLLRVVTGGYAAGQDPATLLLGAGFLTIAGSHTTTGIAETLTIRQALAAMQATLSGDDTSTVPIASGTATITFYLPGQPEVPANIVAVSTVTYDANKQQVNRSLKFAQPFPAVQ